MEGANIPMRENIENVLFKKGIIIVPDFVANAGGVISSYAEYKGCNPKQMFEMVEKRLRFCAKEIMEKSIAEKRNPRKVAMEIALKRIEENIIYLEEPQELQRLIILFKGKLEEIKGLVYRNKKGKIIKNE